MKQAGLLLLGYLIAGMTLSQTVAFCADEKTTAEVSKASPAEEFSPEEAENPAVTNAQAGPAENGDTRPIPVASVVLESEPSEAGVAKKNDKTEPLQEPVKTPAPVMPISHGAQTVPGASPVTDEMKKNWDALFSKELTPDSILYTVKTGDSLYVLAKKYKTTVDLIKKMNGMSSDDLYPNMKLKIYNAPFSIEVNKKANTLVLYANNKPVKQYSVATGKNNGTPAGTFKISNKLVNPTWFKTGAILPPGSPENALGSRWMGFDRTEYGIHGTIEPQTIGTQASQGCVRMLNADVEELYSMVPSGTQVTIKD